jgi:spore coat polysaccharide biosynthesis predicted glycosyltransferase SpsG
VIVGPGHPENPGLMLDTVIRDPHDLPRRLAAADVAVLSAGTMKFEAACLGVPMVLVAAADDQLAVGPEFAGTGAALWAGDGRTLDPAVVRDLVAGLLADPVARADLRERAQSVVDGHGADRLSEAIIELAISVRGSRRSGGYRRRAGIASQS